MEHKMVLPALSWGRIPFQKYGVAKLLGNCSYSTAQVLRADGSVTEREYRWYRLFWIWGTFRLSDVEQANLKQHQCRKALGAEGLDRRFARVAKLYQRFVEHELGEFFAASPG